MGPDKEEDDAGQGLPRLQIGQNGASGVLWAQHQGVFRPRFQRETALDLQKGDVEEFRAERPGGYQADGQQA